MTKFGSTLLATAALSIAALLSLTACGGANSAQTPASDTQTLTLFTDSDVDVQNLWKKTLIPAFEKKYPNITVKLTAADTSTDSAQLAKLAASVKTGHAPGMDVVVDAGFLSDASTAGLLAPITPTTVSNLKNVESVLLGQAGEMPYRGSAVVLAYDSATVTTPPTTLTGLLAWIKAHPGKFTYNSPSTGGSGQGFVQAVLDSHLTDATVKAMSTGYDEAAQSGWSTGFKDLAALRSSIYHKIYPNGNVAALNLLGQGQITLVPTWSDLFLATKANGGLKSTDKAVSISDPALPGGASYLAIPKNSTHRAAAQTLLNWVLEPPQQAYMVTKIAGFPAISTASLPAAARSAFEGIDTTKEAPFYSAKSAADMNSQWQKLVP